MFNEGITAGSVSAGPDQTFNKFWLKESSSINALKLAFDHE